MAGNLITSVLSLATNLLPSITASAQAPSSSSNYNNSQKGRARAVEEDLERLMRTLKRIKATMYDAEQREIIDHSVKLWLKELKKVAYDAEDVLSEYQYEVTCAQVVARKTSQISGSHKGKQMEYIVQIPDGMVDRLNKIRSQFDEIAKDREALQLRKSDGGWRPNNKILRPPTSHMVDEPSIFGRETEMEEVIDSLLSKKEIENPFLVISLVGKGGLGKTTIAQLVYKNEWISRCFDLLGWVCVAEEFDVRRLVKATIESISKINYSLNELSPLQEELANTVKGKTIFLVLDDVWNENQSLWELFRVSFKEAKFVRILMTTRNKKVADVMQATTCFRPTNLREDFCWQLFQHYAFSGTSENVPKHLVEVGREIMRKCSGLPLAVKSIACLLRHETYDEGWREILESDLWESNASNDIFPALQISYDHLPAHLKPCFLFCSMYPKDYLLKKMNLIELWISHGYIMPNGKRTIIEIGVEYYEELKGRSFLEFFFYKSTECCKLHDIIHDLARLNSENEHYSVEINQPIDIHEGNIPLEAYHLYVSGFVGYVNQILHQNQQNLKGLRTLSTNMRGSSGDFEQQYCRNNSHMLSEYRNKCWANMAICNLTKFRALRVLEMKGDNLTEIPQSISKLKHLAYLGITSSHLRMLPLSIGLLYNLQALILDCFFFEYLPETIGNLTNLQFLYILSETIQELPKSLGSLTNLLTFVIRSNRLLDYVPHGHVNFPAIKTIRARLRVKTIAWLKDMKYLEGTLSIVGLVNMRNLVDAQQANLRNKCKVENLELSWDIKSRMSPDTEKSEMTLSLIPNAFQGLLVGTKDLPFSLLECLQPHPDLKNLLVRSYPSGTLPRWMNDPFSLPSIQRFELENCDKIQTLSFGNFHTLKYLSISDCSSIRVLQQLPPQLKSLNIERCGHLELITILRDLDMLDMLHIVSCNLLRVLPDGLITSNKPSNVLVYDCGFPNLSRTEHIESAFSSYFL